MRPVFQPLLCVSWDCWGLEDLVMAADGRCGLAATAGWPAPAPEWMMMDELGRPLRSMLILRVRLNQDSVPYKHICYWPRL